MNLSKPHPSLLFRKHSYRGLRSYQELSGNQQGLTLIECLVAIVVVALTIGIISPPLLLSVATRVQSQRIQQATDVAQGEIDTVRRIIDQGSYTVDDLPQVAANPAGGGTPLLDEDIMDVAGPAYGIDPEVSDIGYVDLDPTETKEVDLDDDGENDFAIQVYRTEGKSVTDANGNAQPVSFALAVRVYDYDALGAQTSGNLDSGLTGDASAGLTSGDGERKSKPLTVLYTTIVKGENSDSYCNYFEYKNDQLSTPRDLPAGCS